MTAEGAQTNNVDRREMLFFPGCAELRQLALFLVTLDNNSD